MESTTENTEPHSSESETSELRTLGRWAGTTAHLLRIASMRAFATEGNTESVRTRVEEAVSAEERETALDTLQKIAKALGTDGDTPGEGFGPGPFGRGFNGPHGHRGFGRRGFGRGFEGPHGNPLGGRHGFSPEDAASACSYHRGPGRGWDSPSDTADGGFRPEHPHRGHGAARFAQHAYERGFNAGYERGSSAS